MDRPSHRWGYPADEAYFLDRILGFVETALSERPVVGGEEWLAKRREQLAAGKLAYVAHQYDFLYGAPERCSLATTVERPKSRSDEDAP